MAKQQTFGDKAKSKAKSSSITVKFVKTVKTETGSYKFQSQVFPMKFYLPFDLNI